MGTPVEELNRVRFIHAELDKATKFIHPDSVDLHGSWWRVVEPSGKQHDYTAAEVRAWPETKAKLLARIAEASIGDGSAWLCDMATLFTTRLLGSGDRACKDSVARGLCMYREQLSDALSPGRALTEDGSVRVNEEQAEALGLTKPRTWDADKYNGLDAATYQQLSTLDKRIAAAKAELSKPAPPRFIAEGRQDRALSVTNGMILARGSKP